MAKHPEIEMDPYEGLPDFNMEGELNRLEDNNKSLQAEIEALKQQIQDKEKLKAENLSLKTNMSTLLATAKGEISRKDRMLSELRAEFDNIILRRFKKQDTGKINTEHIETLHESITKELNLSEQRRSDTSNKYRPKADLCNSQKRSRSRGEEEGSRKRSRRESHGNYRSNHTSRDDGTKPRENVGYDKYSSSSKLEQEHCYRKGRYKHEKFERDKTSKEKREIGISRKQSRSTDKTIIGCSTKKEKESIGHNIVAAKQNISDISSVTNQKISKFPDKNVKVDNGSFSEKRKLSDKSNINQPINISRERDERKIGKFYSKEKETTTKDNKTVDNFVSVDKKFEVSESRIPRGQNCLKSTCVSYTCVEEQSRTSKNRSQPDELSGRARSITACNEDEGSEAINTLKDTETTETYELNYSQFSQDYDNLYEDLDEDFDFFENDGHNEDSERSFVNKQQNEPPKTVYTLRMERKLKEEQNQEKLLKNEEIQDKEKTGHSIALLPTDVLGKSEKDFKNLQKDRIEIDSRKDVPAPDRLEPSQRVCENSQNNKTEIELLTENKKLRCVEKVHGKLLRTEESENLRGIEKCQELQKEEGNHNRLRRLDEGREKLQPDTGDCENVQKTVNDHEKIQIESGLEKSKENKTLHKKEKYDKVFQRKDKSQELLPGEQHVSENLKKADNELLSDIKVHEILGKEEQPFDKLQKNEETHGKLRRKEQSSNKLPKTDHNKRESHGKSQLEPVVVKQSIPEVLNKFPSPERKEFISNPPKNSAQLESSKENFLAVKNILNLAVLNTKNDLVSILPSNQNENIKLDSNVGENFVSRSCGVYPGHETGYLNMSTINKIHNQRDMTTSYVANTHLENDSITVNTDLNTIQNNTSLISNATPHVNLLTNPNIQYYRETRPPPLSTPLILSEEQCRQKVVNYEYIQTTRGTPMEQKPTDISLLLQNFINHSGNNSSEIKLDEEKESKMLLNRLKNLRSLVDILEKEVMSTMEKSTSKTVWGHNFLTDPPKCKSSQETVKTPINIADYRKRQHKVNTPEHIEEKVSIEGNASFASPTLNLIIKDLTDADVLSAEESVSKISDKHLSTVENNFDFIDSQQEKLISDLQKLNDISDDNPVIESDEKSKTKKDAFSIQKQMDDNTSQEVEEESYQQQCDTKSISVKLIESKNNSQIELPSQKDAAAGKSEKVVEVVGKRFENHEILDKNILHREVEFQPTTENTIQQVKNSSFREINEEHKKVKSKEKQRKNNIIKEKSTNEKKAPAKSVIHGESKNSLEKKQKPMKSTGKEHRKTKSTEQGTSNDETKKIEIKDKTTSSYRKSHKKLDKNEEFQRESVGSVNMNSMESEKISLPSDKSSRGREKHKNKTSSESRNRNRSKTKDKRKEKLEESAGKERNSSNIKNREVIIEDKVNIIEQVPESCTFKESKCNEHNEQSTVSQPEKIMENNVAAPVLPNISSAPICVTESDVNDSAVTNASLNKSETIFDKMDKSDSDTKAYWSQLFGEISDDDGYDPEDADCLGDGPVQHVQSVSIKEGTTNSSASLSSEKDTQNNNENETDAGKQQLECHGVETNVHNLKTPTKLDIVKRVSDIYEEWNVASPTAEDDNQLSIEIKENFHCTVSKENKETHIDASKTAEVKLCQANSHSKDGEIVNLPPDHKKYESCNREKIADALKGEKDENKNKKSRSRTNSREIKFLKMKDEIEESVKDSQQYSKRDMESEENVTHNESQGSKVLTSDEGSKELKHVKLDDLERNTKQSENVPITEKYCKDAESKYRIPKLSEKRKNREAVSSRKRQESRMPSPSKNEKDKPRVHETKKTLSNKESERSRNVPVKIVSAVGKTDHLSDLEDGEILEETHVEKIENKRPTTRSASGDSSRSKPDKLVAEVHMKHSTQNRNRSRTETHYSKSGPKDYADSRKRDINGGRIDWGIRARSRGLDDRRYGRDTRSRGSSNRDYYRRKSEMEEKPVAQDTRTDEKRQKSATRSNSKRSRVSLRYKEERHEAKNVNKRRDRSDEFKEVLGCISNRTAAPEEKNVRLEEKKREIIHHKQNSFNMPTTTPRDPEINEDTCKNLISFQQLRIDENTISDNAVCEASVAVHQEDQKTSEDLYSESQGSWSDEENENMTDDSDSGASLFLELLGSGFTTN